MQIDELVLKLAWDTSAIAEGQKHSDRAIVELSKKTEDLSKKKTKADLDEATLLRKKNKEEEKADKEREVRAKKQAESLLKLRNEIVAVTTAYLGFSTLKNIGENLLAMNAQIGFSADTLGLSEDGLNGWIQVASQFNASADEVTGAFGKINAMQASFKSGVDADTSLGALRQYVQSVAGLSGGKVNVDVARLTNRDTTSEGFLSELSVEVQKMSLKDATIALAKLGIGPNMARMMHDLEMGDKLAKSKVVDPAAQQAVENAKLLAQQWARIKSQAKGVADIIENDIMPYLKKFADTVSAILGAAKDHPRIAEGVIATGAGVASVIGAKALKSFLSSGGAKVAVEGASRSGVGRLAIGAALLASAVAGVMEGRALADRQSGGNRRIEGRALADRQSGGNRRIEGYIDPSTGQRWHATGRGGQGKWENNTSEVHVDNMNIYTQAKDAAGIASAIHPALKNLAAQTNGSPSQQ